VEGIICNRPTARPGENRNPERTGLGIVRRMVGAYGECYPNLVQHDDRYPPPEQLLQRTVPGYGDGDEGLKLILAAVDGNDPRPVWFLNWGTINGSAPSSLKRALDQVLDERGPAGYAAFKNRLRLSSDDQFGDHTTTRQPPFVIWIDTFRPELAGKRWYHRFSALTATAGGFDVNRDVLTGHGPLGAMYPTNTTHPQKEGDSMTFLYLVPTGMNDPEQPTWGSWAGRYGLNENQQGRPYYVANQQDTWQGSTHRENTLSRWAVHLQNDFKARLDWCVTNFQEANHPDQNRLAFQWLFYPEVGSYRGAVPSLTGSDSPRASFVAPQVESAVTIHLVVTVTDQGSPPLTRYGRVIVTIDPNGASAPPSPADPGNSGGGRQENAV
jgi:hypothetical protein